MMNSPRADFARNLPNSGPLPLENPLPPVVEVVECSIEDSTGCFNSEDSPTIHHQQADSHRSAMVDWAVGQGMYQADAADLAAREPAKMDEAIYEILNMEPGRLEGLHNIGGWIVWFVRRKATGRRRWVASRPKGASRSRYF
jgi:hypothetical protein